MMKRFAFALLTLITVPGGTLAQDVNVTRYDLLRTGELEFSSDAPGTLKLPVSQREMTLKLRPNHRIQDALTGPGRIELYKGEVDGIDGSWVRLNRNGDQWSGIVWDGADYYAIEYGTQYGGADMIVYALKDAIAEPGAMACGVEGSVGTTSRVSLQEKLSSEIESLRAQAKATATQSIDVTVLGDTDFETEHASDPQAALAERLNIVDGIFSDQVGVTLDVVDFQILSGASDPFTTNDASDLLDELSAYKNGDATLRARGLVHLYTGRNLDGTTAGIAFRGSLCSARFGAGLSEGRRNLTNDALIAAHEFGHNFGAPHDGDSTSACGATQATFLMAPSINGSSTFSACSLNEIQKEVASASCVVPVAAVDALPILQSFPASATVGNGFTGRVRVRNAGSATASNVAFALTLPASVSFAQSGLPASCSQSGAVANCTVGNLIADGESSFDFSFRALSAGSATIAASVSVSGDGNAANDSATQIVVIDPSPNPVADLAISATGTATLTTGDSTDYRFDIDNSGSDGAANVTLNVQFPPGVEPQTATGGTSCTVGTTSVECTLSTIGVGASATVTVTARAAAAGSGSISADVSTTTPEGDSTNNTTSIAVTVNDAPPPPPPPPSNNDSSSGGGSGGPGFLLLLLAALTARRKDRIAS